MTTGRIAPVLRVLAIIFDAIAPAGKLSVAIVAGSPLRRSGVYVEIFRRFIVVSEVGSRSGV